MDKSPGKGVNAIGLKSPMSFGLFTLSIGITTIRMPASAYPWPAAAGPPGPGGHYFFANNALEGILYFISPHLGSKRVYFDNKQ